MYTINTNVFLHPHSYIHTSPLKTEDTKQLELMPVLVTDILAYLVSLKLLFIG